MNRIPSSVYRGLIRAAYLLPALSGLVLLIYACVPHLFFTYNGAIYNTLSPFQLMGNTWSECRAILEGTANGTSDAVYFSYTMSFFVILAWAFIVLFAVAAIASAICSCMAFAYAPTDKDSNRAKRWMQFFCPNRPLYVLANLLPLLPAAFPYILQYFYRTQMGYEMIPYFMGIPDLLLAAILVVLDLAAFLCLLPAQSKEHMDMFRLYKAKKGS